MFKNLADWSGAKSPSICRLNSGGGEGCDREIRLSRTEEQAR